MNIFNSITGFADEIAPDLYAQVEALKRLGIHYVEMRGVDDDNLIFHRDKKVKEIKAYLDDNGISLSALGSPIGKIDILDHFAPHFDEFKRAVEVAHMMETPYIRMFSFFMPMGDCSEAVLKKYEGAVFERIGQMVDYAKSNEIVLLHENEKEIYGEKAAECKKLMDAFYGNNFKAVFDFANFVQAKENTIEAYNILKPYISYIHVKDALLEDGSVVPAGMGDGNVEYILKDLISNGYDGFLSIEPHLSEFVGFDSLERNGKRALLKEGKVLSGFEAFELAFNSLKAIL